MRSDPSLGKSYSVVLYRFAALLSTFVPYYGYLCTFASEERLQMFIYWSNDVTQHSDSSPQSSHISPITAIEENIRFDLKH